MSVIIEYVQLLIFVLSTKTIWENTPHFLDDKNEAQAGYRVSKCWSLGLNTEVYCSTYVLNHSASYP